MATNSERPAADISADTRPFQLPTAYPNRTVVHHGDVIYDHQRNEQAWVGDDRSTRGVRVEWLGSDRPTERYGKSLLDRRCEDGVVEILASGLASPSDCWWDSYRPDQFGEVSLADLEICRERSRAEVNRFLDHPLVDHKLGSVTFQKAMFGARYQGDLVAVCVLTRPKARMCADDVTIQIHRYAAHPGRPPNTASWLISEALEWAKNAGYHNALTYAGVSNDNEGTIYQALSFEYDGTTEARGDGWQSRDGRDAWENYQRRRYVKSLRDSDEQFRTDPADRCGSGERATLATFSATGAPNASTGDLVLLPESALRNNADPFVDAATRGKDVWQSNTLVGFGSSHNGHVFQAAVVDEAPDDQYPNEYDTVRLVRYADRDLDYPTNAGAWLVSQIRAWAIGEGYDQLESKPIGELSDHQQTIFQQAGFTDRGGRWVATDL